ncbi:hypothetical protein HGRIS_014650 [Hohenbuehelia grisea]|uniref:Uncharacterized protein n=1 Tax=Hohenbuehelia grisea TaxID=104357 RepID=A0ABR3JU89_9AGAR
MLVKSRIFSEMPINVVRLRDMKLLRRDALESEIIGNISDHFRRSPQQAWDTFQKSLEGIVMAQTQYAILSHRWDKDELDYAKTKDLPVDFLQRCLDNKGHEKIRKFCEPSSILVPTFGSIPGVSTNRAVLSWKNPSVRCSNGIGTRECASYTWRGRFHCGNCGRMIGSFEDGRCRSYWPHSE